MHTIADGEGPGTFEDSMYQDYQWARSGTVLFLRYIPPYFHKCTWRVKLRMVQIAFCWLVFSSFTVLLQIMVGVAALGAPGQSVLQLGFKLSLCQPGFLFGLQVTCASLMLSAFINHNGWMRPIDTPVVSWEAQLHLFCHRFFILKVMLRA
jgi:cellulose synthase/poly-beta-1,6-N-acetylglucosamine synthase-like glycosyltransferase